MRASPGNQNPIGVLNRVAGSNQADGTRHSCQQQDLSVGTGAVAGTVYAEKHTGCRSVFLHPAGRRPMSNAALLFIVGWVGGGLGGHSPGRLYWGLGGKTSAGPPVANLDLACFASSRRVVA